MVYIYAFLGRLLLYPYLNYRLARLLPYRASRIARAAFILEFSLSTLSLLVHRFVMHEAMSLVMSINLYIFFALGYTTVFVMGANILGSFCAWAYRRLHCSQRGAGQPSESSLWAKLPYAARHRIDWTVALLAVGVFASTIYIGHRAGHHITISSYSEEAKGRPRLARLVLITDLHIGEGVGIEHVRQVVDSTLKLQPDLILFGGDFIDHDCKYAYQPHIMAEMRRLKAPDGIYFVPGNHEYRLDSVGNFDWVRQVGGTLLLDSIVYPRDSAYALIGRDDYVHRDTRKSIAQLLTELKPQSYNILLEHTPMDLDSLSASPIDYALYGHTHAGQLWPYRHLMTLRYKLPYGTMRQGRTQFVVSSGVGAAGTLFRLGTKSEIVVIDLYQR